MSDEDGDYFYDSPDGLRLYCRVHAARRAGGLPVLCLPGLTRNGRDFAKLAAHLCARHEVLRLDLRGRGRSAWDKDPSHYQLPTYVADVDALLESRGVARIVVVGTSLGALMGLVLAANRPDRIAALVLNDAGPELDPSGLRRIAAYAGKLPPVRSWGEAAAQTQRVYESALPGLSAADWLEYAHLGYREDEAGIPIPDMDPRISTAFANSATAPGDLWPVYAKIPQALPILVIRGATSDILSAATLARMVREKPNVESLTVANRGHTPLLNEPECLSAIDDFLARHGRAAGRGQS